MYEMLVGQPPFTGQTFQSLLGQHMTEAPAPLRRFRPEVPRGVNDAVRPAIARECTADFRRPTTPLRRLAMIGRDTTARGRLLEIGCPP